ncbi:MULTISPECIES: cobaltochelatase CobT-related protein [unclassified Maridesulfovibrio]|uniref:cobaltochelatase CobT-related protein n=1 Tax=unclassified Maridesulfovibrio TaxID=2794999 RepID=UPI003B3F8638
MNNKLIMKSLPLVASVLGRKYGVKVSIGGNKAFTDGRTIQLPALPLDSDETLRCMVRGYLDHEAAHIRETNFEWLKMAKLTPFEMHIWNSLEDWRVENKLAEIFPGCRQNFHWLIRKLFINDDDQPQSGKNDLVVNALNWILLKVRSWDVPDLEGLCADTASVIETHHPGLTARLDSILQQVRTKCDSTQDCILYTREIVAQLKAYLKEAGSRPKNKGRGPADDLDKLLKSKSIDLPKGFGEVLEDTLTKLAPDNVEEGIQVAKDGYKKIVELDKDDLDQTRRASTALKSRLHGIIQAKTIKHDRIGRHGRLSTAHLHRIAVGNPRMFRRRQESRGINTAVHILMDCSGSMRRRIGLASKVCHTVVSALNSINGVNVGVSAFPAVRTSGGDNYDEPTVAPVLNHGQKLHSRFGLAASGSTPLGEALWWTFQQMLPLPENRKIILCITDGVPDNPASTQKAIKDGSKNGFEIYGLGINSEAVFHLFPGKSRVITELSDLAPAMFDLLQESLTK